MENKIKDQKFRVRVSEGKLSPASQWEAKEYKKYLKKINGDYDLILRKHRKPRSTGQDWEKSNQNGYYWGVVIPKLVEYYATQAKLQNDPNMAYDADQVHEGIKFLFLNEGTYSMMPKIKSTKKLDSVQWESLMQQIRDWAADELHVYISEPMTD